VSVRRQNHSGINVIAVAKGKNIRNGKRKETYSRADRTSGPIRYAVIGGGKVRKKKNALKNDNAKAFTGE